MSCGRGRGYAGRHAREDARPGEPPALALPPLPLSPSPARAMVTPPMDHEINGRVLEGAMHAHDMRAAVHEPSHEHDTDDEKALAELLHVEELYKPIVHLLEQFNVGEDGIIFNRKLKELEAALGTLCNDETELIAAFSSLRGAALSNAATARKLASVGASFNRQQRQHLLRNALLNNLQTTFAKLDVLERSNPQTLINAATLLGDFYMEARLSNGCRMEWLCPPLLQYMRSLLASHDKRAHRALATQLMQNGKELLAKYSPELDELSISVRRRVLVGPPASTVWLLLSADLCLNRFRPLPASLQAFYASNLDLLSEDKSYSEVQYGAWKKEDEPTVEKEVERGMQQMAVAEDGSVRKLRPILGAGARQNTSLSESSTGSYVAPPVEPPAADLPEVYNKSALAKRYDLNSWRQQTEVESEQKEDHVSQINEFQFSPTAQDIARVEQKYSQLNELKERVEQKYTQEMKERSEYAVETPLPQEIEKERRFSQEKKEKEVTDDKQNPAEKNSDKDKRRPHENWRKDKKEERRWGRQKSKESEEDKEEKNFRDGAGDAKFRRRKKEEEAKTPQRRHAMDPPRGKYWDHDDRLDKDYNS